MLKSSSRRRVLKLLMAPSLPLLASMSMAQEQTAATARTQRLNPFALEGLDGSLNWSPPGGQSRAWLYLDFWASWCGPCRLSFPWMNRMHEQWQGQGLRIVAVTVDRRREDALAFLKANPARFQIAFDTQGSLARNLDIKTMPTSLLVAPDGRIVHRHEGFTASLGDKAAQAIKDALGAA